MEITHEDSQVRDEVVTATGVCQGSFRLRSSEEYAPMLGFLTQAAEAKPAGLTLDVRQWQFLNSSGINTLSTCVLQMSKHYGSQRRIQGSISVPWQERSLKSFQRLLPGRQLEWT